MHFSFCSYKNFEKKAISRFLRPMHCMYSIRLYYSQSSLFLFYIFFPTIKKNKEKVQYSDLKMISSVCLIVFCNLRCAVLSLQMTKYANNKKVKVQSQKSLCGVKVVMLITSFYTVKNFRYYLK